MKLSGKLQQIADAFQLPGMAVVVVQHGDVIFSEGFGYADLETGQPFTPDTLCLIASATKSFTAGLAGCLVDRGLIDWTRPVREYIPGFKMIDDFATQEITLEDMLCHRSGLPWHENLLTHGVGRELPETGRAYRAELLKRLAYFDPAFPFRTRFQYQDIVYTCAGAVLEHVTGQDYEALMDQYLLQPLGMTTSTFARSTARATGRLAQHYDLIDDQPQPIAFCDTRYIAPSAGLYSTANELARWLQLQLDQGRFENQELISTEAMAWIHQPHMAVPGSTALGGGLTAYGQGWYIGSSHGQPIIGHGGSFNGHRTFIGFAPEKQAGVAVLSNLNLVDAPPAAGLTVLDHLLGVDNGDARLTHYLDRRQFFRAVDEETAQVFAAGRNPDKPPTQPLGNYQGHYEHPGYGVFDITYNEGTLYQTFEERTYPLSPYNGDTLAGHFQSTENRLLDMTFTFERDNQGQVVAVRVPLIPDIPTPRFVKMP